MLSGSGYRECHGGVSGLSSVHAIFEPLKRMTKYFNALFVPDRSIIAWGMSWSLKARLRG